MKNLVLTAMLLFTIASIAQRKVTKEIIDFTELKVFDLIQVNLIKSSSNKLVIHGDKPDDVKVVEDEKKGVVKLRLPTFETLGGKNTRIDVYYKELNTLDANEGAEINSNETVSSNRLTLRAQEGGIIDIAIKSSYIDAKAVTGGEISASGTSKNQEILLNSGGKYLAESLQSELTKIKVKAGGEGHVRASGQVDVNITAGGDVYIYGNPKEINKKKLAGGRIKIID